MSTFPSADQRETIWSPHLRWITAGAVALIFLAATEALAVTTVMPIVAADLHGEALYALAFAGTLATSVIGMVAVGALCDRIGPRKPLYAAVTLFFIGLLLAGFATSMPLLIAGRLVQGLGAGGQTVALYVVVARVYPPVLHGRVFAAFAAAWVVPSMVGPFLAGAVAQYLHWRWAFLGVAILTAIAFLTIAIRLSHIDLGGGDPTAGSSLLLRLMFAVLVSVGAVIIGITPELPPASGWPIAALGAAFIVWGIRPLVPRGTLRAARGLPSVVLMRGIVAGSFFAGEAYIPYLLMENFDFTPTWAGLALTAAALSWATGSALQGRYGDRWSSRGMATVSIVLVLVAIGSVLWCAVTLTAPWVLVIGWGIGGGGMGLIYPRLTVLTLAYSLPQEQGFNSAALTISDAAGSSATIALAGLVALSMPQVGNGFGAVYIFAAIVALVAFVPGLRLQKPLEP
ncbi:MFS transporter [Microbacterium sp. YY-01]|uniref:MFS transporter n=1 Tax=Microbacterium sp. YY-01 TaxID=3421634 RepID=UPI003D17E756